MFSAYLLFLMVGWATKGEPDGIGGIGPDIGADAFKVIGFCNCDPQETLKDDYFDRCAIVVVK